MICLWAYIYVGLAAPKNTTSFSDDEDDEEDEEEEQAMTDRERAQWRAQQDDLTMKRKGMLCRLSPNSACYLVIFDADFHGACTYAFKGIFAWQMYSAVDAVDEFGKAYTVRDSLLWIEPVLLNV